MRSLLITVGKKNYGQCEALRNQTGARNVVSSLPSRIKDSKRIIQKNKFKKLNSSKTVMPDDNWQDKQNRFEFRENETVRVRGSDAIHKPSAYFIDISPAYDF